ncbi:MAG TPA: PilZ domain-containing protein [Phycisphaerae bacterium]|nr:PilZ domain-containing protein [Phycisphaerae bacterium]
MDNRKFPRTDLRIKAAIRGEAAEISGDVENVSLNGLFVRSDDSKGLNVQDPVEVQIELTGNKSKLTIECNGRIARSDKRGVGIHIQVLDVDTFMKGRNLVAFAADEKDRLEKEFAKFISKQQTN